MATLLNPFLRADDANGNPVSGGQLAVFLAGTTTPVTTYSDRALTTAQAQPLIANSAGEFAQSFVASGIYKIRVSDADGVTLYENDNVRIAERPDDPVFFATNADVLADTNTYAEGTDIFSLDGGVRFEAAASGATVFYDTNAGGQKLLRYNTDFPTVAALEASTDSASGVGTIWTAERFSYVEQASGSTDFHIETAGGVKLKHTPLGVVDLRAVGAVVGNTTNQLEALRAGFELAEAEGLAVAPEDGVYYVTTNGVDDRIALKKFPSTTRPLRLKWNITGGGSNRIMTVDATEGLTAIATLTGSPTINQGDRTFTTPSGLDLAAGDWVAIRAGEDESDSNQPSWACVTRVESYSGTTLKVADGAPFDVYYNTTTTITIWKLDVEPVGGSMSLSVDYTGLTRNPTMCLKISYARGWEMPMVEQIEPDFGIAIADGAEDFRIGTYISVQTATQDAARDPRQAIDIYSCRRGVIDLMHLIQSNVVPAVAPIHLESHAQDIRVNNLHFDGEYSSAPSFSEGIIELNGNSQVDVGEFIYNANQIGRVFSLTNTLGKERCRVDRLIYKDAGITFNPAGVLGDVIDEGGNGASGAAYKIGPLQEIDVTLEHDGGGLRTFDLGNMLVQEAAVFSSALTSAVVCGIYCTDDITRALTIPRTTDSAWVRAASTTPDVRWDNGGGGTYLNRLDLTAKIIRVNYSGTAADFRFKVLGRFVDADQF